MNFSIINGKVACPFDESDIETVNEIDFQYTDEASSSYEVPSQNIKYIISGKFKRH